MSVEVEFESLVGKHILSGVESSSMKSTSEYSRGEECNCMKFVLDGVTYIAIEDPDDGYRSSLGSLVVSDSTVSNRFKGIEVIGRVRGTEDGILEFIDTRNGNTILEVGTDHSDNYYPYFVANWNPENLEQPWFNGGDA